MNKTTEVILSYLRDNRMRYISGSYISDKLNMSRAAVNKHVSELRRAGYCISARQNLGYRLVEEPDLLDRKILEENGVHFVYSVESTNFTARSLAEKQYPEFTTVIAEEQTAGKGRRERSWFSPPGSGLWFSIILRPALAGPAKAAPLTLVTAAAISLYFNRFADLKVKVKWPNDLLISGKKTGGILCELKGEPDHINYLIVGIGINVNQAAESFPPELGSQATSLSVESGKKYNRTDLFFALKDSILQAYDHFIALGFSKARETILEYNTFIGKTVSINLGEKTLNGLALDLDSKGCLLVKDMKGTLHRVNYGEIT